MRDSVYRDVIYQGEVDRLRSRGTHHCLDERKRVQQAVARSLRPQARAKRAVGRRGGAFERFRPSRDNELLPSSHKSGSVGAMSKLAPVVRGLTASHPTLGNDDREHMPLAPVSPSWGRAREHRELNRRDDPRHRSGKRGSQHRSDPPTTPWNRKRKPGHIHAVRKALRAFRE